MWPRSWHRPYECTSDHRPHKDGGRKLTSFESYTGGLIAPETDPENPWRYKFTWNPRNVVMAGQGTAKFLEGGRFKYLPYQQLFKRLRILSVPGFGEFEGYVNRDSLHYRSAYGLDDIPTMMRGTLRSIGFCAAWDVLVQLGCCDDTWKIPHAPKLTHADFIDSFLPAGTTTIKEKLVHRLDIPRDSHALHCLEWSGFFDAVPIGLEQGTPAQITEHILNKKWKLSPTDKDMVVMWHRFTYVQKGVSKELQSSLVAVGEDSIHTAMAKTVGLPLGIAAKLLLEGKINVRGVVIPTIKEIYIPVLAALEKEGITLQEF